MPEDPDSSNMVLNNKQLVDPGSSPAKIISRWLQPIENSYNINIFFNFTTMETEVHLPRLNLDFICRKTGLESKQFRGMRIDLNQQMGTLHGKLFFARDPQVLVLYSGKMGHWCRLLGQFKYPNTSPGISLQTSKS